MKTRSLSALPFLAALTFTLAVPGVSRLPAEPPTKPAAPAAAKESIEASEAEKLKGAIGREVTVTGRIVAAGQDAKSGNVFLNFSRDRDSGFVAMIQGRVAKGAGTDLKEKYQGKEVAVTGVLSLFKNKTEIVVQDLAQIAVR